jgi:threonine synthase
MHASAVFALLYYIHAPFSILQHIVCFVCTCILLVICGAESIFYHVQDMFEEKRNILEPAGALALAGAEAYCKFYGLKGDTVVAITSGANMNFDRLRLVTELADVGRKREAVLATFLPEEQGSFKNFTELVCLVIVVSFSMPPYLMLPLIESEEVLA